MSRACEGSVDTAGRSGGRRSPGERSGRRGSVTRSKEEGCSSIY
jgi:hypothetical protein